LRFGDAYRGSSFIELLESDYRHLKVDFGRLSQGLDPSRIPHGTTVLAFKYAEGVMVAGDRLATEGHRVASRDIEKVFPTDSHSLIAIAGAAGPAIEMARLMRIELEHYEKIEGELLEIEGKANKLSQMIRANLPAAMQGLVVVPLFAGYDLRRHQGRLWKFDVTGGRYEETEHEATGSGGLYARESLKKSYRPEVTREEGLRIAVQALTDAADEDRATGGVDLTRRIFPVICHCNKDGISRAPDEEIESVFRAVVEGRS
jgi:proteasome beta subunit